MLFTAPEFFIFLAVVILGIELLRKQLWQHLLLAVASYFFYWWSGSIHVLLLAFVTIASYLCGAKLFASGTEKKKKLWLAIGTIIPLAVLAYFKYIDWGIESINSITWLFGISAQIPLLNVILPVGISFFTFQALSYVFDIYLGKLEPERKFTRYLLFIAFFPALVAGPIVRASEFLPQLKDKIKITGANLQAGVTLIVWGLFKKMVIADNIAPTVNSVFSNPAGTSSIWIIFATILFGIQIYCDFSGYAHIALGCGRIFGFKLLENFDLPYFARNIQVFWRKWHMTLSRFIRDYVYIPLGGNRKGHARTYVNLLASMIICGLWHGAAWTFVIWGAYHGVLLLIHRFFVGEKKFGTKIDFFNSGAGLFLCVLFTQIFVFAGWLIFRAESFEDLFVCIQKIVFFDFMFSALDRLALIAGLTLFAVFFVLMFSKKFAAIVHKICYFDYIGFCSGLKLRYWIIYIIVFVVVILLISPPDTPEFIYFAF